MPTRHDRGPRLPRIQVAHYMTAEEYAPQADRLRVLKHIEASANPCPRCPGHCCQLLLSLTVHDVARICVGLSVRPEEFCFLQARTDDWNSPPVDVEGTPMHLMLDSGTLQSTGNSKPCVFLHTMHVSRRCSIYELRPMTCRLYPFRWYEDDQLTGPRTIWCPDKWLVDAPQRRRVTKVIRQSLVELAQSAEAIQAFNRQRRIPHTSEAFLTYAIDKGAEFLKLDARELLQPRVSRQLGRRIW
ncbi:MAG: YkgJ family cysteine cluster protein [Pseudomonadota bacterium]